MSILSILSKLFPPKTILDKCKWEVEVTNYKDGSKMERWETTLDLEENEEVRILIHRKPDEPKAKEFFPAIANIIAQRGALKQHAAKEIAKSWELPKLLDVDPAKNLKLGHINISQCPVGKVAEISFGETETDVLGMHLIYGEINEKFEWFHGPSLDG